MIQAPSPISFEPPKAPDAVFGWLQSFLRALNKFIQQTASAIKALSELAPSYRLLDIKTDGAGDIHGLPITFDNPRTAPPVDVHVAKVTMGPSTILDGPVTVVWVLNSLGQIQVNNITGLDNSETYSVTLSVS